MKCAGSKIQHRRGRLLSASPTEGGGTPPLIWLVSAEGPLADFGYRTLVPRHRDSERLIRRSAALAALLAAVPPHVWPIRLRRLLARALPSRRLARLNRSQSLWRGT